MFSANISEFVFMFSTKGHLWLSVSSDLLWLQTCSNVVDLTLRPSFEDSQCLPDLTASEKVPFPGLCFF